MFWGGFGGGCMMRVIVRVIHILGNTVRSQTRRSPILGEERDGTFPPDDHQGDFFE
jgi:hypothetical protein